MKLVSELLGRLMSSSQWMLFVREVLGAVLMHQRGTLRFLKDFTPRGNPAITAHLGKTGTPVNAYSFVTDKIVTGSLVVGGRYYSYFFAVRAPNPAKYPLGKSLGARHFAPMVELLLKEIPRLTVPKAKAAVQMGTSTKRDVGT